MITMKSLTLAAVATVMVAGAAEARDQIRIVGSSTVFPFSTAVAEQFGRMGKFKTPVVESTGTGGGFKLFCAGVGEGYPDITNASRRIKKSEFDDCTKASAKLTEVKIGFDGIVVANSRATKAMSLTLGQLFLALAKQVPQNGKLVNNPYRIWSDIDKSLPNVKIEVLGPPPTSGTRDAFVELAMEGGCAQAKGAKEAGLTGSKCHAIREDGAWIDAGENDNLIVQRIEADPNAVGIFGYSFLYENADKLQGVKIAGVEPTFDTIADASYGLSRPLFIYIKNAHRKVIPGMNEFVAEYTSDAAMGKDGYLHERGLVVLSPELLKEMQDRAKDGEKMSPPT